MKWAVGVLVVVLLGLGAWQRYQRGALAAQIDAMRLTHANALAARDTTVTRLVIDLDTGADVRIAERLAFQSDTIALHRLLRSSRANVRRLGTAVARFTATAESLEVELAGAEAERDTAGTITAAGALRATDSIGVDVEADVTIAPDFSTVWRWRVVRAQIPLELTLACEGDRAITSIIGPPWAGIAIDSVVQRADICIIPTPVPTFNPFGFRLPSVPMAVLIFAGGMLLGR